MDYNRLTGSMALEQGPDAVSLLDLLDRMLDKGIVFEPWARVCLEEAEVFHGKTVTIVPPLATK